MAVDTATKRASAMRIGRPWASVLPVPAGGVTQDDRQTVSFMYGGILAVAAAVTFTAAISAGVRTSSTATKHGVTSVSVVAGARFAAAPLGSAHEISGRELENL